MKLSDVIKPDMRLAKIFAVILAVIAGVGAINMLVLKTNLFVFKEEMIKVVREEMNPVSYDDLMQVILEMNKSNNIVIDSIYSMANKGYSDLDTLKLKSRIIEYDVRNIQTDLKDISEDIKVISKNIGNIQTRSEHKLMNDSLRNLNKRLIIEQTKNLINNQKLDRMMIINEIKNDKAKENIIKERDYEIKRKSHKKFLIQ